MPGTLEFAIHTLVEKRLDMSIFEGKYCNDETGGAAYDPKILLKVILLAYSPGLISSRKIEKACHEKVVFIVLACCRNQEDGHELRQNILQDLIAMDSKTFSDSLATLN